MIADSELTLRLSEKCALTTRELVDSSGIERTNSEISDTSDK